MIGKLLQEITDRPEVRPVNTAPSRIITRVIFIRYPPMMTAVTNWRLVACLLPPKYDSSLIDVTQSSHEIETVTNPFFLSHVL